MSKTREIIAGFSTFLAMAYILFVNPHILSATGLDAQAVFIATSLSAGIGCLLVGCLAGYPIAVAPGMALNVYFALILVDKLGFAWQEALAASFLAAVIFLLAIATGLSAFILRAIPKDLHIGILLGLGLLLISLALKNIGFWHFQSGHVEFDKVNTTVLLFSLLGFLLILGLDYLKLTPAVIIGVIFTSILGFAFGKAPFYGLVAMPTKAHFYWSQMNFKGLTNLSGIDMVFSLFFVLLFDCVGTFLGLLQQANIELRKRNLNFGLFATGIASVLGSFFGTSGISAYSESAVGINVGGRGGLTSIVVGLLFLLALFFLPLAKSIPSYATAPALLFVGLTMLKSARHLNRSPWVVWLPCVLTALAIPITFSIAEGIATGVISYVVLAYLTRQTYLLQKSTLILSAVFVLYLALLLVA